ncbi:MAG: DUF973 family protein [Sulfolobales archaeon]
MIPTASQAEVALVRAFIKMREGLLLELIGWVILGIGLMLIIVGVFAAISAGTSQPISPGVTMRRAAIGWVIASLALLVIGAVIALVGFYAKFVPGVGELARARPEFGTASSLIKVGYIGGLILLVVGAVLLIVLVGVILILVGLVFLLVGHIGAAILCFKLSDAYRNSLYLAAGIILVVSVIFPILGVVSWILLYIALGDTISRLQSPPPAVSTVQQV